MLKRFLPYLFLFALSKLTAQSVCPANIGFEDSSFNGWTCLNGKIDATGNISLTAGPPITNKHTLFKASYPAVRDPFGDFPVTAPNGSNYSIRLGDSQTGAEATAVAYTFTIPANAVDYSIIYDYAVVLENPTHNDYEQPKFTTKVFDVTSNKYITCGAFEFIASPNLPGFRLSSTKAETYFKDWAPITINLAGYAGKTIRLEFTVNDCTKGGHFGYAYLDVNENCSSPVTGNVVCDGLDVLTLKAPYGFMAYRWYTSDFSTLLGSENILNQTPAPASGTTYALEIFPYPNQGCLDTILTTIVASPNAFKLNIAPSLSGCEIPGVDITDASATAGSGSNMTFAYYADANELIAVPAPKNISQSGRYYIKGSNTAGCTETKPLQINVNNMPQLVIKDPEAACLPATVNLAAPAIIDGSDPGTFSYWANPQTTTALPGSVVTTSGTYYLKSVNQFGCATVKPVNVSITAPPNIRVTSVSACDTLMLSEHIPVTTSDAAVAFSYWRNAAATEGLSANEILTKSTIFYIKATALGGCTLITPSQAIVYPAPDFKVTNPPEVERPAAVDLTVAVPPSNNWSYSYWLDAQTTKRIAEPREVIKTGIYYIQGLTSFGCATVMPVNVLIKDPLIVPPNVFTPNNDGINDTWLIPILLYYPEATVEIFNRTGQNVFKSYGYSKAWDGTKDGKGLPLTTYYYIIRLSPLHKPQSGSVTLLK